VSLSSLNSPCNAELAIELVLTECVAVVARVEVPWQRSDPVASGTPNALPLRP